MNANLITIADQAKSILGTDFRPSTDWKLYQSVARSVAKEMLDLQEECLRMKEYIESICCECDNCVYPTMCSRCEALGIKPSKFVRPMEEPGLADLERMMDEDLPLEDLLFLCDNTEPPEEWYKD